MAKTMYDIIKKQNGERFAKAIRNYDNGIFDIPDLDKIVKYAGRNAEPIMRYLMSLKGVKIVEQGVHQDPIELLARAGYDAYVADTLEKQNAIKKYYAPGEELCTFRDPARFKKYFIINAVRKDVAKIKRSRKPMREDEYGTSVISIQVLKTGGFISIKNRYNHTVENPDNTLNSNPDNIIPGLSDAIKHHFDVDFSSQKESLPNGFVLVNGQICKYCDEINNVYCGSDFYVKDGHICEIDKRTEIMLGGGLLFDIKNKKIIDIAHQGSETPVETQRFIKTLQQAILDKKIQITKNPQGGYDIVADTRRILTVEDGELVNINIPDAEFIYLPKMAKARGVLDFSNVKELTLQNADLSQVSEIKFNPNAKSINLHAVSHIPSAGQDVVDFSGVDDISLSCVSSDTKKSIKINPASSSVYMSELSQWGVDGVLDLSNVDVAIVKDNDMARVTDVRFNPHASKIQMTENTGLSLRGKIDFSAVDELRLSDVDMSQVGDIKFNPSASQIQMLDTFVPLRGVVNFSDVQLLDLSGVDASQLVDVIMPRAALRVLLSDIKNLNVQRLDLRDSKLVTVQSVDLSNVSEVLLSPYGQQICLTNIKGMRGKFNLGGWRGIELCDVDLSKVDISINPYADSIYFENVQGLHGVLPLSRVSNITLRRSDLSKVSVDFNKDARSIYLEESTGLHGELDFSGVDRLGLKDADLSKVLKIKLPEDPTFIDVDPKQIFLRVGRSALEFRIAQLKQHLENIFNRGEDQNV